MYKTVGFNENRIKNYFFLSQRFVLSLGINKQYNKYVIIIFKSSKYNIKNHFFLCLTCQDIKMSVIIINIGP